MAGILSGRAPRPIRGFGCGPQQASGGSPAEWPFCRGAAGRLGERVQARWGRRSVGCGLPEKSLAACACERALCSSRRAGASGGACAGRPRHVRVARVASDPRLGLSARARQGAHAREPLGGALRALAPRCHALDHVGRRADGGHPSEQAPPLALAVGYYEIARLPPSPGIGIPGPKGPRAKA